MLPDRVSNPGPLTYESGALPIALRLVSEISYAMTLSVRLCLSLFMTEIAFKWVYSRIASPSRTATER